MVGIDTETDLALIKIDADHDLPVMKFGDSNSVQVGDWVLAAGSPFGLRQTVTAGSSVLLADGWRPGRRSQDTPGVGCGQQDELSADYADYAEGDFRAVGTTYL